MSYIRISLGVVIWAVAGWAAWYWVSTNVVVNGEIQSPAVRQLVDAATKPSKIAKIEVNDALDMEVGDPIFMFVGPDKVIQVGEIRLVRDPDTGELTRRAEAHQAEVLFYSSAPHLSGEVTLVYYDRGQALDWVLGTMLPAAKRDKISAIVKDAYQQHHEEILQAMLPLVQQSLRESAAIIERDLPIALARHSEEFEKLGRKYQKSIVDEKILPLVKKEIWPIVQEQAKPMAEEVAKELWKRLPKWGLIWRFGIDRVPGTSGMRTRNSFAKYLENDAMPFLEENSEKFIALVQRIMKDVSKNEEVRSVMRDSIAQMVQDPELQQIVWKIVREAVIDNPALSEVLVKHWTGTEAKEAMKLALDRIDPALNDIGHLLFGKRGEGFTDEFVRVLRAKVLRKDRRWFVLQLPPGTTSPADDEKELVLRVELGEEATVDPFLTALAKSDHD